MIIRNKILVGMIYPFIKHKERKLGFTYEQGLIDDEVLDKSYARQYLANLKEAVEEHIQDIEKKYGI